MNNKTQQQFDRSIADAVRATQATHANKPRRDVTPPKSTKREAAPKGRLFLCPQTGATIWEPAA